MEGTRYTAYPETSLGTGVEDADQGVGAVLRAGTFVSSLVSFSCIASIQNYAVKSSSTVNWIHSCNVSRMTSLLMFKTRTVFFGCVNISLALGICNPGIRCLRQSAWLEASIIRANDEVV